MPPCGWQRPTHLFRPGHVGLSLLLTLRRRYQTEVSETIGFIVFRNVSQWTNISISWVLSAPNKNLLGNNWAEFLEIGLFYRNLTNS